MSSLSDLLNPTGHTSPASRQNLAANRPQLSSLLNSTETDISMNANTHEEENKSNRMVSQFPMEPTTQFEKNLTTNKEELDEDEDEDEDEEEEGINPQVNITTNQTPVTTTAEPKQRRQRKRKVNENENKQYQTLLLNSRSRHLKKNDGEPYWRNEIQFEFLMRLFFNYDRVFRNPFYDVGFDWPDHFKIFKNENGDCIENDGKYLTFFELYLVTLLKSSKISKILKARLMLDINYALNFSIVCLLVNIGRLNTTVNFDHEMRSQFRTYHSVPSLQVGNHLNIIKNYYPIEAKSQNAIDEEIEELNNNSKRKSKKSQANNSNNNNINNNNNNNNNGSDSQVPRGASGYTVATVKQLQDTPRIKSILKSVNDLNDIPKTFTDFINLIDDTSNTTNRLNLISIIFLLCVHEYEIGRSFYNSSNISANNANDNVQLNSTGSLFNDIWMRPIFSPSDKVQRFLWLIYTFMETDLKIGNILRNPFNRREYVNFVSSRISNDIVFKDHMYTDTNETNEIISTTSLLLPILNYTQEGSNNAVDILINDYDTEQEVEYAAFMKELRAQFLGSDNSNSVADRSLINEESTQIVQNHELQSENGTSSNNIGDPSLSNVNGNAKTNNSDQTDLSITINNENNDSKKSNFLTHIIETDANIDPIEELAKLAPLVLEPVMKNKSIFDTIELGSLEPSIILAYDESNNDIEFDGQRKRKRTKKQLNSALSSELPLNICVTDIESMLNSQLKSANSHSKSSILKRNKNRFFAEFIFELIRFKQNQCGDKRKHLGNWEYLVNRSYDLSFFLQSDSNELTAGNWGEFKVTMLKCLTRLSCTLNSKMEMDKKLNYKVNKKSKLRLNDFLDDAFSKL